MGMQVVLWPQPLSGVSLGKTRQSRVNSLKTSSRLQALGVVTSFQALALVLG